MINDYGQDLDRSASWDLAVSAKSLEEDGKVDTKFIWRLNPFAFRTLTRTIHNNWRHISSHSIHLNLFVVRVQGRNRATINESPTPSLCGLTLGIGQIFGFTYGASTNLSIGNAPPYNDVISGNKSSSSEFSSYVIDDNRSETETDRFVATRRELSTDNDTISTAADDSDESACSGTHDNNLESHNAQLNTQHWMEIDASLFTVRSKTYLSNKRKVSSSSNLLRLMTVDFVEVSKPIMTGFCSLPHERVQRWLATEQGLDNRGKALHEIEHHNAKMPKFVFCINIVLPGPPHYHFVMYFAVDDFTCLGIHGEGKSNEKKPFSQLLDKFLFGPSDEFRNQVLKVVPRIVEGNVFLKAAVGNTPVLLGQRLKPRYIQTERFLEVIIDVSTHAMTERLVKLATAFGSDIIAEFGFVLEGNDEQTLPENILGSIRLKSNGFDGKIRFVDSP